MAGQALAGTFGSFSMPGTPNTPVAQLNNWSITATSGNYDASVLGDTWRNFVSGLKGWSGSLAGFYSLVSDPLGQKVLYNALVNNLTLVGVFQTVQGGGSFEGSFHVISSAVSNPVDGLITINFDFQGTGSLQVLD